jgi:hypothetical protein
MIDKIRIGQEFQIPILFIDRKDSSVGGTQNPGWEDCKLFNIYSRSHRLPVPYSRIQRGNHLKKGKYPYQCQGFFVHSHPDFYFLYVQYGGLFSLMC